LSSGDKVLVFSCGAFGERFAAICKSYGVDARRVDVPYGRAVEPDLVRDELAKEKGKDAAKAVLITHNETSTGVLNPIKDIAAVVRESGKLFLVDSVSGAGDAVDEEELSRFTHDGRDVLDRVEDARRCLVVRDEDRLRGVLALLLRELVANEIGLDRAAVGNVDAPRIDSVGLADRGEALAERAAAEHEDLVAGRERVCDGGFHA